VLVGGQAGMALGGWLSGKVFDLTGAYDAAFVNGIGWNLVTVAIIVFLLWKIRPGRSVMSLDRPTQGGVTS
jgi:hypothetical protein